MNRLTAGLLSAGAAGAIVAPLALAPAAGSATAARPSCPTILTRADSGKTIRIKRGKCDTLRLTGFVWSRPASANADVAVVNAPSFSGTPQWYLKANHLGATTITSSGRPHCNPHQACPQFIILFRMGVRVVS
jgi:hypothetical protein